MGHYRTRHKVQILKLDRELTVVTEFDRRGNPKKFATIPNGHALIAEGEGEDQEIKWMEWDEAMQHYEPEEEIGTHADESPRAAARRHTYEVDDPRRDGYREPRRDDHPRSPWRDAGSYDHTSTPDHSWPSEPYVMHGATLLPPAGMPAVEQPTKRTERV